jgi:hypothetical protein
LGERWLENTLILSLEGFDSVHHDFFLLPTLLNKRAEEAVFVFKLRGVGGGVLERGAGYDDRGEDGLAHVMRIVTVRAAEH